MISLTGLILFASCRLSFPAKTAPETGETEASAEKPSETVIRSDAMEMQSPEGSDTVFRFTGNVRVESDKFRASAQALTAHLSGNPIEENPKEGGVEASPHLTRLLAEGKVRIQVQQEEGERLGSADRVEIDPPHELFILSGHAQVEQKGKGTVAGERIVLDRRKNSLSIGGDLPEGENFQAPSPHPHLSPEGEASQTPSSPRPRLRLEPTAIPEAVRAGAKAETAAGATGGEASGVAAAPLGQGESVESGVASPEESRPEGGRNGKEAFPSFPFPSGEHPEGGRNESFSPFSSPLGKVSPLGETASPAQLLAPEGRGLFAADAP
ncbi:MAG: LptA/OstA family protein [Puniceicoccales bacterium]|jgi:lipopolysaccharide export system protein LptA|nr:LptA/OstA family protein [Puniceicoccales bacterium]